MPVLASRREKVHTREVSDEGLEQAVQSMGKSAESGMGGAESGALVAPPRIINDPELAELIAAWTDVARYQAGCHFGIASNARSS